jgi:hypothetical protein
MRWFRWYRDASSDVKFRLIADHAANTVWPHWVENDPDNPPVNVRDVIAVWIALLERVTDNNGSVTVTGVTVTRYLSIALDIPSKIATAIVDAMVEHGLLDPNGGSNFRIPKWQSRQYVDTTNAERQARHRQKKVTEKVTERNGVTVTPTETDTDTEAEGKREGANAPRALKEKKGIQEKPFTEGSTSSTKSRTRGTQIPADWVPTDHTVVTGLSYGWSHAEIDRMAEDMRLWAGANGAVKKDWEMTFMGWMRREKRKPTAFKSRTREAIEKIASNIREEEQSNVVELSRPQICGPSGRNAGVKLSATGARTGGLSEPVDRPLRGEIL